MSLNKTMMVALVVMSVALGFGAGITFEHANHGLSSKPGREACNGK